MAASNTGRAHPRRRPKAEHTVYKVVTDAVFHVPMFALNADVASNVCEPNQTQSMPTESARKLGADTRGRGRNHVHSETLSYTHSHSHTPTWTHTCAPV